MQHIKEILPDYMKRLLERKRKLDERYMGTTYRMDGWAKFEDEPKRNYEDPFDI